MNEITGKLTWLIVMALALYFILRFLFPVLGLIVDFVTALFHYVGRTLPR